jgi:L-lactate dehydrogenase
MESTPTIAPQELEQFLQNLFSKAGLEKSKTDAVSKSLVDAQMIERSSHGVALAPWYLDAAQNSQMTTCGNQTVLSDRGACFAWNGNRLPGAWLITEAIGQCLSRVQTYGTVTASISNSFHTGALAVYLPAVIERGYMAMLTCSSPGAHWVAPFGGTERLFATNPIAAGIPTTGQPVLLDVSCSITTLNQAKLLARQGLKFPGQWAIDAQGNPTDDPADVIDNGGSLLPVGGLDHGHKGYAFALLIEALTHGLTGFGRANAAAGAPDRTSTNIYLQVIDPDAFGGGDHFREEMTWVAEACKTNKPRDPLQAVRIPGERALAALEQSLCNGVSVAAPVVAALLEHARKLDVPVPSALQG